jgi:hypothetical protein
MHTGNIGIYDGFERVGYGGRAEMAYDRWHDRVVLQEISIDGHVAREIKDGFEFLRVEPSLRRVWPVAVDLPRTISYISPGHVPRWSAAVAPFCDRDH